jgi:O-antigen/teichoic acid export membrane protein
MYFSLFGALLTISINLIFIPKIGFMASAYATLFAYGFMMALSYFIGRKHYTVPYETNKIGAYLLLGTALSFITYYALDRDIVLGTLFLFLFVMFVVLIERKELKQILNKR